MTTEFQGPAGDDAGQPRQEIKRQTGSMTRKALALLLGAQLALAACQGGGDEPDVVVSDAPADGGTSAPPAAPPAPAAPAPPTAGGILSSYFVKSFDIYEEAAAALRNFDRRYTLQKNSWTFPATGSKVYHSYPLASARVEYAHAAGLTGAGQLVSVVDSGFLPGHEVFDGKSISLPGGTLAVADHGTSVAAVLAGDGAKMIGVAPHASLAFGEYTSAGRTAATIAAKDLGAVAQNNSWGFPDLGVDQNGFRAAFDGAGASYLSALDAYAAEGVVVFAASNDAKRTAATLMEALPALRPSLESGWLAVINGVPKFDSERILSVDRVSAPCLEAARWCLVADGTWIAAASSAPDAYTLVTGSSFAAPQVSGALALLAEAFPSLDPHALRIRLLASADNSFFQHDAKQELVSGFWHGYNTEFGHGFLDLRAALLPIGGTEMELASGGTVVSDNPLIVTGAAVGDAVVAALSKQKVLVADALGGDFLMPGQTLVARNASPAPLEGRLVRHLGEDMSQARESGEPEQTSLFDGYSGTIVAFDGTESGFSYTLALPGEDGSGAFGATVSRSVTSGAARFDLGLNLLQEEGELLGLSSPGSGGRTDAIALDFGATAQLDSDLSLTAAARFGQAAVGAPEILTDVSAVGFSSLSVGVGRRNAFRAGDKLTLSAAMPNAIVKGSASVALPVARSAGGTVFDDVSFGLAPDDRQVDFGVSYQVRLADGWEAVIEGTHAVNRGHSAGNSATAALIGIKKSF